MLNGEVVIVVDDSQVQVMLERLNRAISTPSLVIFLEGDASEFMRDEIVQRFAYEGDSASGDWEPLSDATLHIKKELPNLVGSPQDINIRTGEMFNALTGDYPVVAGAGFAQLDVPGDLNDNMLERKLRTAQRGSNDNPMPNFGPTPARPVLATSETQLGELLFKLEHHILDMLHGSMAF